MNLSTSDLTKLGIALAVCAAVYKLVPNAAAKTVALAVGGTIIAKQLPFVGDAL